MTVWSRLETVVVIPARNEEERIGTCLHALASQTVDDFLVVLVANNCTDGTARLAQEIARAAGLNLDVVDCTLSAGQGVGTARRLGLERAMAICPAATQLLTTDADCVVAQDWVDRNRLHLQQAAAVCGLVMPMPAERGIPNAFDLQLAEREGRYEALVTAFYRRMRPDPFGLEGDHACAAGASLGVRAAAYRDVGGFAELVTGEDRDLVRRLKSAGHGVRHCSDVRVDASCRLDGRARDGMAAALRARGGRTDYFVDDALPPAQMLVDAARQNRLGPWPLRVAPQDRLRVRELEPHIALLERTLGELGARNAHAVPTTSSAESSEPGRLAYPVPEM